MAARPKVPPIADAGLPAAVPIQKITNGIGKASDCYLKYRAMIEADLDQALKLIQAKVIVSQTAIDAWTTNETEKVREVYGRCASCLADWLKQAEWEAVQLAAALVPPELLQPAPEPQPVPQPQPQPGPGQGDTTAVCPAPPAGWNGQGYYLGANAWVEPITPGLHPYTTTFPWVGMIGSSQVTQAAAMQYAALYPAGSIVGGNQVHTQGMPNAPGYWGVVAPLCRGQTTTTPCQPPAAGCPVGTHWDSVACACVPDVPPPPPAGECCPLPGQRVTVYSDNTWTVEGDVKDFPQIAALLSGVVKVIGRDDPPGEAAEWELDEGPPDAAPDLVEIDYQEAKTAWGQ